MEFLPIPAIFKRPDDDYFRAAFSIPIVARRTLEFVVPKKMLRQLDLKTLTQCQDTFVDKRFRRSITDLVFTCAFKNGGLARICFLLEHKSRNPGRGIFPQIGRYLVNNQEDDLKKKQDKFTLTIPIIFYHGSEKLTISTIQNEYGEVPAGFVKYIPNLPFLLIDLQKMSRETMVAMKRNLLLRTIFLSMKKGFDNDYFRKHRELFLTFVDKEVSSELIDYLIELTSNYIYNISSLKIDEIMETAELVKKTKRERRKKTSIQVLTEYLEKKGMEKGMEEGMEKGMEKGMEEGIMRFMRKNPKMLPEEIAFNFDVPIEKILDLKKAMEN